MKNRSYPGSTLGGAPRPTAGPGGPVGKPSGGLKYPKPAKSFGKAPVKPRKPSY